MKSARYIHSVTLLAGLSVGLLSRPAICTELGLQHFPKTENCVVQSFTNHSSLCRRLIVRVQAPGIASIPADIGRWQLVRTPGPQKDHDVVSIMHTADTLRSDPDFAGLLIRCQEKTRLQIGLVVIQPFPPKDHPKISINGNNAEMHLEASVLPGGVVLGLPAEAEVLAKGPWQKLKEVSFGIQSNGIAMKGIIPLENLSAALAVLYSNCPDE
jgi:hypothetical protein